MTRRKAVRMGAHTWLLLATIVTELLVIRKWVKSINMEPFPIYVKWAWSIGAVLLVLYPLSHVCSFISSSDLTLSFSLQFGIPSARKYLHRSRRELRAKTS